MVGLSAIRRSVAFITALALLALTGCASATKRASAGHGAASTMMGQAGASGTSSAGLGMMGGRANYHYSKPRCSAPSVLPGRTVAVTLADMGMTRMMSGTAPMGAHMMLRATPATEPAGKITFVASNMGWRTHELVILPLATGAAAGQLVPGRDGKVDETSSLGEASKSCTAGTGHGITVGAVGWITLTLAPGRYELICNLVNHYANGMHRELVVT